MAKFIELKTSAGKIIINTDDISHIWDSKLYLRSVTGGFEHGYGQFEQNYFEVDKVDLDKLIGVLKTLG